MTGHTVSVVLPTLGRPSLLRAVRSALGQDHPVEVLVVVADPRRRAEVDALLADVAGASGGAPRLLEAASPLSAAAARNLGVHHATGDLTAFLDDDDWWEPGKIAAQVAARTTLGRPAVISTRSAFGPAQGARTRIVPGRPFATGRLSDYVMARPAPRYGRHFLQTSSLLVDTDVLRSHRWDEQLDQLEDWDLVIRLVDVHGTAFHQVPDVATHVDQGSPGSASQAARPLAALAWARRQSVSDRAFNDFVLTHVLRPALASGDRTAWRQGIRSLRGAVPHASALAGLAWGAAARGRRPREEP